MKKAIHPDYQEVLFIDSSTGHKFVCGSTLKPKTKEVFNGKEYPAFHVSVSSSSHPYFTGSQQFVDTEGRVDKFKKRYTRQAEPVAAEEPKKPFLNKSLGKKAPTKVPAKPAATPSPKAATKPVTVKAKDAPSPKPGIKAKDAPTKKAPAPKAE